LGSRDWTSAERDPWPDLGEVEGNVRRWNNGRPGGRLVTPTVIGDANCLANGAKYPILPPPLVLIGDYDSRCPPLTIPAIDQSDCHFQQWALDVIAALYSADLAAITAAIQARYPTAVIHTELAATDLTPAISVVRISGTAIVLLAGTNSALLWAIQLVNGLITATDYRDYITLGVWQHGADVLSDVCIRAGVNATQPVIFCGHSLGGAIGAIQAFRAKQFTPGRNIGLLTWGAPRPGDERLITGLFGVNQQNYVANLDPIPLLPPSGWETLALRFVLPGNLLRGLEAFRSLQNRILLLPNGQQTMDFDEESILFYLVREITRWLTLPVDATAPYYHSVENYRRLTICPTQPPPPPPDFFYVGYGGGEGNASAISPIPVSSYILLETGDFILLEAAGKILVE